MSRMKKTQHIIHILHWLMNLKRLEGDPDYILFFGGTNDYIDSNFKIDTFIQYYANTVDKVGHPKKNGMAAIADEVCKVL